VSREELIVVTKVGHVSEEELASSRWAGGSREAREQVSSSPVGGHHCIHKDLIAEQAYYTLNLNTHIAQHVGSSIVPSLWTVCCDRNIIIMIK